jgi:hypothetical protein
MRWLRIRIRWMLGDIKHWWQAHTKGVMEPGEQYHYEQCAELPCGSRWFQHGRWHTCTHPISHLDGGKYHWDQNSGCTAYVEDDERPLMYADMGVVNDQYPLPPVGTRVEVAVYVEIGRVEAVVADHWAEYHEVRVTTSPKLHKLMKNKRITRAMVYPGMRGQWIGDDTGGFDWGWRHEYDQAMDTGKWVKIEPDLSYMDDPRIDTEHLKVRPE